MAYLASVLNSGAHSFGILGVKNCLVFFNFPVSGARPENFFFIGWYTLTLDNWFVILVRFEIVGLNVNSCAECDF